MITRMLKVYDLQVFVSEKAGIWSWTVRTLDEDYLIPLGPGPYTHHFQIAKGVEEDELECIREGTAFAVRTARSRIQPFRRRYLDNLVKINLGEVVEEAC